MLQEIMNPPMIYQHANDIAVSGIHELSNNGKTYFV